MATAWKNIERDGWALREKGPKAHDLVRVYLQFNDDAVSARGGGGDVERHGLNQMPVALFARVDGQVNLRHPFLGNPKAVGESFEFAFGRERQQGAGWNEHLAIVAVGEQSNFGADDWRDGIVIATMVVEAANRRPAGNGQVQVALVEDLGVPKDVQLAEGANDQRVAAASAVEEHRVNLVRVQPCLVESVQHRCEN